MTPTADHVWRVRCCGKVVYEGPSEHEAEDLYGFLVTYHAERPQHQPVIEHAPRTARGYSVTGRIMKRIHDIWDNKLFRMSWAYREWREIVDNLPRNEP